MGGSHIENSKVNFSTAAGLRAGRQIFHPVCSCEWAQFPFSGLRHERDFGLKADRFPSGILICVGFSGFGVNDLSPAERELHC